MEYNDVLMGIHQEMFDEKLEEYKKEYRKFMNYSPDKELLPDIFLLIGLMENDIKMMREISEKCTTGLVPTEGKR